MERILESEAVPLFSERAYAADSTFRLSDDNVEAVASLCRHLDGIPLAIELAAARIKTFTVEQLAERVDDRFSLLTGGSRTALPRHRTLRRRSNGAMTSWTNANNAYSIPSLCLPDPSPSMRHFKSHLSKKLAHRMR